MFDIADGDVRIAEMLISIKDRYLERAQLLARNCELHKLRVSAELRETDIDVPFPVPAFGDFENKGRFHEVSHAT